MRDSYSAITPDPDEIWSKIAQKQADALLDKADKQHPDFGSIVRECKTADITGAWADVSNEETSGFTSDEYGYICMEIIEKQIDAYWKTIKSSSKGKGPASAKALHLLEALTLFLCREQNYAHVDDGYRWRQLAACIAAAYHDLAVSLFKNRKLYGNADIVPFNYYCTADIPSPMQT